ncbi:hypothetical protein D3C78_1220020 [compost metagenome]
MQAAVTRQQPERTPALIDIRRCRVFKPANIMTPEAKARQTNRQPTAQAFRHRFIVGVAVAAPMHREFLRTDGCGTRKQDRLFFAHGLFQHVPHQLVIDIGVMVVHFLRIGTVMPQHIGRDAFTKVRLEAIDADIHQAFQLVGVPFAGVWICKIVNCQPRLPLIPLPHRAVRALQQITLLFQFLEHR